MSALLKALDWVPGWVWALTAALALAVAGVERTRAAGARVEAAQAREALVSDRATAALAALTALEAERVKEKALEDNTRKVIHEAQSQALAARADADRAGAAAERLSGQLAKIRAAGRRACPDPAAAGRGASEPGADPIGVLADVLARADARAGVVEQYADALRVAGGACERYGDGLRAALVEAWPR